MEEIGNSPPFACPNTCTIIRNKNVLPSPFGRQKFPIWGLGGSFPELPNLMYVQAAILAPSSIRFQGHWYPISKLV
jgi:hypothetical protein